MGKTVPYVINDLINGVNFFFGFFWKEGLKTEMIVRMSVFHFFIVILNVGDGCSLYI